MKKGGARLVLVWTLMVLGLGLLAAPAAALFPPAQAVSASIPPGSTTVEYSAQDPISLEFRFEAWTLSQGDQRFIDSLQVEKGIVTWIARYKNFADTEYQYEIHYRIFDPGRGVWKGGFDSWMTGSGRQVTQHQVRDGVVAFKASHKREPLPVATFAVASTYDPASGDWVSWWKGHVDPASPEVLSLRDGVLAYPVNPLGYSTQYVAMTIYDRELQQWVEKSTSVRTLGAFNWLEIGDGTVHLNFGSGFLEYDRFFYYDPFNHVWNTVNDDWPSPIRRASFVVQPASGYAPLWVCFWDTSFAMNSQSGTWTYNFGDGMIGNNRSWVHKYWNPGTFPISMSVSYGGQSYLADGRTVTTQQYLPPPTGGITIDAGATYANSLNVTLQLSYNTSAVEMCFMNLPGIMEWTPWESVTPSKSWQLSTFGVYGNPLDGEKTVSVKFRDGTGVESQIYQAAIILDVTPPAPVLILNYGADTTRDPNVRAEWWATDANGVDLMRYTAFNEGDLYLLWTPWLGYQWTTMTFPFSNKGGTKTVMVEFMDIAGNVIQVQDSVRLLRANLPFLPLLLGN